MRKLINRYKDESILVAMFLTMGLVGNMFYEDDVLQHQLNCLNAAYVADNNLDCGE